MIGRFQAAFSWWRQPGIISAVMQAPQAAVSATKVLLQRVRSNSRDEQLRAERVAQLRRLRELVGEANGPFRRSAAR